MRILEIRRVLGAAWFRRMYRAAEAGLFAVAAAGYLAAIMWVAYLILGYSKRNGLC